MFDRRLVTHFDWIFMLLVVLVAVIGIVNLFSATAGWTTAATPIYLKQVFWFGLGMLIVVAVCLFDYRHLEYMGLP
ncbi:MAG: rod shape-determining protein RodA, partial [Desulfuromonadales bacterium]